MVTAMTGDQENPEREPNRSESEDSERSRFARFAKKLVQVPKKEIDEKAEEWKRDRERKGD
jgi:TPP-dependent indolepyruvate ferredoxin oxidoreductase alpha subunit